MSKVLTEITTNFLKNLIKKYDNNVTNLEFSTMSMSAGENYASTMCQITINYVTSNGNNKEMSLMMKHLPEDALLADYAQTMKFFDNEIDVYIRILPSIYSLEYVNNFSATALYASLTPKTILILEDLSKSGYKMQCRHKGLDLHHCMSVIHKLAYLHASSLAISKKESLSNFNLGMFWKNQYTLKLITIGIEAVIKTCTKFRHLNEYAVKLERMQNNISENTFASIKNSSFKVLNHGDCWINNLMFLYNTDGTIKDVKLLDFQLCIVSSPVIDLHFFWTTSPNMDVLTNHFSDIMDYYYNEFLNNVKKLKLAEILPSKHEIVSDFKKKAIYGLTALITATTVIKSTKRPDASFENYYKFSGEDSFRHDCFNNECYVERITHLLPFYDSLGLFS